MATEKRERQRANRQAKFEQVEKDQKTDQARHYGFLAIIGLVTLAGAFFLYQFATSGDDDLPIGDAGDNGSTTTIEDQADGSETTAAGTDDTGTDDTEVTQETSVPETTNPPEQVLVLPDPGASIDGEAPCPAEDGSSERTTSFSQAPPLCIDPAKTYTAEIDTTLGLFSVELDATKAPNTVNNFVFLSRYHFYENASFHRIISDFVIQGGDPIGPRLGTGGPGYAIDDELPEAGDYQVGSLAMANSGPDTSGSQFFVITGESGVALPPQYSLFGQVTEGLDIVEAIEALPTGVGDQPTEEIYINSVTILEN